ncbi:hypothetical protein MHK_002092, partial [Candidatus Magnetomorum sp. HK-1]
FFYDIELYIQLYISTIENASSLKHKHEMIISIHSPASFFYQNDVVRHIS